MMQYTAEVEKDYKEFLDEMKLNGMTAEALKSVPEKYNEAAEKTLDFLSQLVLRSSRNRSLINATGYPRDMFADDITLHILRKLDAILACSNEAVIPYTVKLVNREVVSICRKWKRTYPDVKENAAQADEAEPHPMVSFLDDVAWGMIADDTNVEDEVIAEENAAESHDAKLRAIESFHTCSRFELLSLLVTKVIPDKGGKCMKNRDLAEQLDALGLDAVSKKYFKRAAKIFGVSYKAYFSSFTNNRMPKYTTISNLCDKISKASYACGVKLCKKNGGVRMTRKQI